MDRVLTDGGPYAYSFSRLERHANHEHPALDALPEATASAMLVEATLVHEHLGALDALDVPAPVAGCMVVLERGRAVFVGMHLRGVPAGSSLAACYLLCRAVHSLLGRDDGHEYGSVVPAPVVSALRGAPDAATRRQLDAMPQHSAPILQRALPARGPASVRRDMSLSQLEGIVRHYEGRRAPCERDVLFAMFERCLESHAEEDDPTAALEARVEVRVSPALVLHGSVRRRGDEVRIDGDFFRAVYVTAGGRCRTAQEYLKRAHAALVGLGAWRRMEEAGALFSDLDFALGVCRRLAAHGVVYPRLDPVAAYAMRDADAVDGALRCVLARARLAGAVPRIECTLHPIEYKFGRNRIHGATLACALHGLLGACDGDAAWRTRGRLAPTIDAAVWLSFGVVGTSTAAFMARTADGDHLVAGALRVTRDAGQRVRRVRVLLRNSYDSTPDMAHLRDAASLGDALVTIEWVARFGGDALARRWTTQWSEESCAVHACMVGGGRVGVAAAAVALKLAGAGNLSTRAVRGLLLERCPVAYAAATSYALEGAPWRPAREEHHGLRSCALFCDDEGGVALCATVQCDGSVMLTAWLDGVDRDARADGRGLVGWDHTVEWARFAAGPAHVPAVDVLVARLAGAMRAEAARRGAGVRVRAHHGRVWPAGATALGRALLAALGDAGFLPSGAFLERSY